MQRAQYDCYKALVTAGPSRSIPSSQLHPLQWRGARTSSTIASKSDDASPTRRKAGTKSEEGEQSRLKLKKATRLAKDFLFFTRRNTATGEELEDKIVKKFKKQVLDLCDQAIILSRESSDPNTFEQVRQILMSASKGLQAFIQSEKDLRSHVPEISYEVFLIRSGYLQVVRTILALVGEEAVEVCTKMLIDYFKWERWLADRKDLDLQDGTEQLPTLQAKLGGKLKEREEKYFYGPFIQDSAIVLHDVFSYLKLPPVAVSNQEKSSNDNVSYRYKSRYVVAKDLWAMITIFDKEVWKRPLTVLWSPLLDGNQSGKHEGQYHIASAMMIHGKSLRQSGKLLDCAKIWRAGMFLCANGAEKQSTLLLTGLVRRLRHLHRDVFSGKKESGKKYLPLFTEEYFDTLEFLLFLLKRRLWSYRFKTGLEDTPAVNSDNIDSVVQLLLSTEDHIRTRSKDAKREDYIEDRIKKISRASLHWIRSWLLSKRTIDLDYALLKQVETCNVILEKLIVGSEYRKSAPATAVKFLGMMMRSSRLPNPDSTTFSIMLKAAKAAGNTPFAVTIMRSLSGQVSEENESLLEDNHLEPEEAKTPLVQLLEYAVRQGDLVRTLSLLQVSRGRTKGATKRASPLLSQYNNTPVEQLVFLLYPSLDLKGREEARLQGKSGLVEGRTEAMNSVVFHPKVLVSVLRLVVRDGKTGLAERVWRLIQRAHNVQWSEQEQSWPIPIQAYTLMIKLYTQQIRRGTKLARRVKARRSSILNTQNVFVRGWGLIKSGPSRFKFDNKRTLTRVEAARLIVMQEYKDLQERWSNGRAEKANEEFWQSLYAYFHKLTWSTGRTELENEQDVAFQQTVREDMKRIESSP